MEQINYPYVSDTINELARNMLIKTTEVVHTDKDHFNLNVTYDLVNMNPHPENTRALSVFGEAMLLDYNNYHFTTQH